MGKVRKTERLERLFFLINPLVALQEKLGDNQFIEFHGSPSKSLRYIQYGSKWWSRWPTSRGHTSRGNEYAPITHTFHICWFSRICTVWLIWHSSYSWVFEMSKIKIIQELNSLEVTLWGPYIGPRLVPLYILYCLGLQKGSWKYIVQLRGYSAIAHIADM